MWQHLPLRPLRRSPILRLSKRRGVGYSTHWCVHIPGLLNGLHLPPPLRRLSERGEKNEKERDVKMKRPQGLYTRGAVMRAQCRGGIFVFLVPGTHDSDELCGHGRAIGCRHLDNVTVRGDTIASTIPRSNGLFGNTLPLCNKQALTGCKCGPSRIQRSTRQISPQNGGNLLEQLQISVCFILITMLPTFKELHNHALFQMRFA